MSKKRQFRCADCWKTYANEASLDNHQYKWRGSCAERRAAAMLKYKANNPIPVMGAVNLETK